MFKQTNDETADILLALMLHSERAVTITFHGKHNPAAALSTDVAASQWPADTTESALAGAWAAAIRSVPLPTYKT